MNFVVPPLDGTRTGGTVYNSELIQALGRSGVRVRVLDVAHATLAAQNRQPGPYWVDSLYLAALPELRAHGADVSLIAHYLPTLVARGADLAVSTLAAAERLALEQAHSVLATSAFMRGVLRRLGVRRTIVVEPGTFARARASSLPSPQRGLRAILVANYLPGKGIEPFLRALGPRVGADDAFRLEIIGSSALDPGCALRCLAAASRYPELRRRLALFGSLTPDAVISRLERSNLLVSSSRMESFGMVIAEARTLGLPIFAQRAGNVQDEVVAHGNGVLVEDGEALARAFIHVARAPAEHERYVRNAYEAAVPARSWDEAAREFMGHMTESHPAGPNFAS